MIVPSDANYTITGANCQIVSVDLGTDQRLECEPGAMMFMSDGVKSSVECGKCSRLCAGEKLCKSVYTNTSQQSQYVAITPSDPQKIVPIDLSKTGKIVVKPGAYVGSIGEVSVEVDCNCCSCAACCSQMGIARQGIVGTGTVFLALGGTIVSRNLKAGEVIKVDEQSIVGFQDTAKLGLATTGGCCTCCCAGEGLFLNTVTGPGLVLIQSMSIQKYKDSIRPKAIPGNNLKNDA